MTMTNIKNKNTVLIIMTSIIMLSVSITHAYASEWLAQQGLTKNSPDAIAGATGQLKAINTPYISVNSFAGHRDYVVYANLSGFNSIGAGWYAEKNSGTGQVVMYNLNYWYDGTTTSHNAFRSLPANTTFTAYVQQDSSGSNCWTATTYFGDYTQKCFSSGGTSGANAGSTAREGGSTKRDYSAGSDDMPGFFDQLKTYSWSGGSLVSKYFSDNVNQYKCASQHGFDLDRLTSYTGGSQYDKVGTGPRTYTTDDCSGGSDNSAYELFGE